MRHAVGQINWANGTFTTAQPLQVSERCVRHLRRIVQWDVISALEMVESRSDLSQSVHLTSPYAGKGVVRIVSTVHSPKSEREGFPSQMLIK